MTREEAHPPIPPQEWAGAVVASCPALGLFLFPILGRTFAAMFHDLGTSMELPLITQLAISIWFPPLLGLTVAAILAYAMRRRVPPSTRKVALLVAFVLGAIGAGMCIVGVYLPIFALAGSIKG